MHFLTKITALFYHIKFKTIDWKISLYFLIGAVPSTILSAYYVSSKNDDIVFKRNLEYTILIIIFLSILSIIFNILNKKNKPKNENKIQPNKIINSLSSKILAVFSGLIF